MFVSKACFDLWAVRCFTNQELRFCYENPSKLSTRHFKSLFLYSSAEVTALWRSLEMKPDFPLPRPEHLLWTLYYLKVYPTWDNFAMITGTTEKTLRKWVDIGVQYLAGIKDWVRTTLRDCWY
jgi:DDE superfamily endonuclease